MDSERWQQLCAILDTALTLDGAVRKSYLDVACKRDSGLRAEIEHLLENEQKTGLLDESPPLGPLSNWGDPIAPFPVAGQDLLAPGAVIAARYRIVEMLGRGGMGEVYRAFDCHSKATVALKKLTHASPAQILRFKREFRSLADLLHPNLVRLYELSGEAHQWFFTMELIKGEGFIKYVRPNGLDWNRLRAALAQLASGIDALHVSA